MKKFISIKTFISTALTIGMVILIIINAVKTYYSHQITLEKNELQLQETLAKDLDNFLKDEAKELKMEAELILNDRVIVERFANGDRSGLAELTLPIYEQKLRDEFGIGQFGFHTPPATVFYRAHMPNKWGDDVSSFRHTVVETNRDKKITAGLEVGKAGLGMRLVHPINYKGQHIGSMEFGTSFEDILDKIATRNNVDYTIGVYTRGFDKTGHKANA